MICSNYQTNIFEERLGDDSVITLLRDSKNRRAKQVVMITYYDGENLINCEGVVNGSVTTELKTGEGFGFDYCFIPNSYDKTFSELGMEFKNKNSARKKAIDKLKEELEKNS